MSDTENQIVSELIHSSVGVFVRTCPSTFIQRTLAPSDISFVLSSFLDAERQMTENYVGMFVVLNDNHITLLIE